jgi:3-methyladenine DNA glycosylase AlkD
MDSYVFPLIDKFNQNRNQQVAAGQKKYMKDKFEFLGIKTPERVMIINEHIKQYGKPEKSKMNDYVRFLWNLPEREYQYTAITLYEKVANHFSADDIGILEYMIENKSWWDTVDGVIRLHKHFFYKYPELIPVYTDKWISDDNFWFRRSALLFQLNFGKNINQDLMFKYILIVKDSNEFFIRKAIGWILRQYSKTRPDEVIRFVETTPLSNLSKKEALKYINSKKDNQGRR